MNYREAEEEATPSSAEHILSYAEDDPEVVTCTCGEIYWANSDHVSPNHEIIRAFNDGLAYGRGLRALTRRTIHTHT